MVQRFFCVSNEKRRVCVNGGLLKRLENTVESEPWDEPWSEYEPAVIGAVTWDVLRDPVVTNPHANPDDILHARIKIDRQLPLERE